MSAIDITVVLGAHPMCPDCGSNLSVSRRYIGNDWFRVRDISLADEDDPTSFVVYTDGESRGDEYESIQETWLSCDGPDCTWEITLKGEGEDWELET